MTIYRSISRPQALKAVFLTAEQAANLAGSPEVAIGLDGMAATGPRQLDAWYADGRTYVRPVDGPSSLLPWTFAGAVAPTDIRQHFYAVIKPALET